ncbi:MAG: riboflavin biosynthesis protein RibF [Deltaproteobacteria bacterium RIFOXYD12_FULL_50_9]|nr:MAG: riboflavin biosynthesis protein RibF [Deltaproteobacteria bacterium RIFOXYD12_FULL_50_9]
MKIYKCLEEIKEPIPNAYVTIGNFDGVHRGHQKLFSDVVTKARQNNGTSVVITFEPHPLKVVRPDIGIKLISTYEQKLELIDMAKIDVLIVIPFTREFANTQAEDFVDDALIRTIGVKELVVGYDYAFGKGRQGDIPFLKNQGLQKGFAVSVVEPLYVDDMLSSSTKIRELVAQGLMGEVKKLLGRFYQIRGNVLIGKQRGGPVVGFPTANIHIAEEDLCPKHGVYVTHVVYAGRCYGGVMNFGYNPTFGENQLSAETHIFNFNQEIYGKSIKINLLKYLRSEQRFAGPKELSAQINRDVEQAKQVLIDAEKELVLSCEDRYNQ